MGGMSFMFNFMPVIFIIAFVAVMVFFVSAAARSISQWNKNNNSPVLTVTAKLIAKRMSVHSHIHNAANREMSPHYTSSTEYYATFEVESGDRIELRVPDTEYGMIVEGDCGRLTFQGTRYKGFDRIK